MHGSRWWDINKKSRTIGNDHEAWESLSTGIRSKQALNSFQCWKRNAPRNRWNPSTNGTLISLDRALDIVLISIHGIIINFESRLLWSREDKSMHTSSFCAHSTEKSFHDSWSFISGTGLCTFPAQPRRSDVEKRSRTETVEPKINKLRMTASAAKRSWKEKPQPITNNRQTAGGDCMINSFSKLHNAGFWVRYSKLGKYNQIYHRKSIEIHWFMK